jgi:hypothetical protein
MKKEVLRHLVPEIGLPTLPLHVTYGTSVVFPSSFLFSTILFMFGTYVYNVVFLCNICVLLLRVYTQRI